MKKFLNKKLFKYKEKPKMALNSLTVKELREILKEHKIVNYSRLRKNELINMVEKVTGVEKELPVRIIDDTNPQSESPDEAPQREDEGVDLYVREKDEYLKRFSAQKETETLLKIIDDHDRVKRYDITGNLNRNLSKFIFKSIKDKIDMRYKVVYSFLCLINRIGNQIIKYGKTLSNKETFTSLQEARDYLDRYELKRLDLDNIDIWGQEYLPSAKVTNNPGVYQGLVRFLKINVKLYQVMNLLWDVENYLIG